MKRHWIQVDENAGTEDFYEVLPGEAYLYSTPEGICLRIKNSRYLLQPEYARKWVFRLNAHANHVERLRRAEAAEEYA